MISIYNAYNPYSTILRVSGKLPAGRIPVAKVRTGYLSCNNLVPRQICCHLQANAAFGSDFFIRNDHLILRSCRPWLHRSTGIHFFGCEHAISSTTISYDILYRLREGTAFLLQYNNTLFHPTY